MEFIDDPDDIDLRPIKIKGEKLPYRKYRIYFRIMIISVLILLGIIIFLIIYFSRRSTLLSEYPAGGFLILNYDVIPENDIIIFNPPKELNQNEYSIEIMEDDKNKIRNLEENVKINNNKLNSKKGGKIEIKLSFKKVISSIVGLFQNCEYLISIDTFNFISKK